MVWAGIKFDNSPSVLQSDLLELWLSQPSCMRVSLWLSRGLCAAKEVGSTSWQSSLVTDNDVLVKWVLRQEVGGFTKGPVGLGYEKPSSQLGGPFWVLGVNWPGKQSFHLVGPTQGQFFSVSSARANWLNIHAHTRIHAHTPPVFLRVHKPFLRMPMSVRWVIFQQKFYYTVWRQWAVSPSVSTKIAAAKQILSKCQTKLIFCFMDFLPRRGEPAGQCRKKKYIFKPTFDP